MIVREATEVDCIIIAANLRDADKEEMLALGHNPGDELGLLLHGLNSPDGALVVCGDDNVPFIIAGTVPTEDPKVGIVWALGTDGVYSNYRYFLKNTRGWADMFNSRYEVICNIVHSKNELHIRWLQWSGFELMNDHEVNGNKFISFRRVRQNV